jgi:hypothetical protein
MEYWMTVTPWIYNKQPLTEIPDGHYAFVYLITNNVDGKYYIGRKFFYTSKTRQIKGKKKKYKVESDWQDYYGSNKQIQEDVERLGKGAFHREILHLCKTKGTANYYEASEIFKRDAILKESYYNDWCTVKVSKSHVKD